MKYILLCILIYSCFGLVAGGLVMFFGSIWIMAVLAGATAYAIVIAAIAGCGWYMLYKCLVLIEEWLRK